jgi:hypothetical protein
MTTRRHRHIAMTAIDFPAQQNSGDYVNAGDVAML